MADLVKRVISLFLEDKQPQQSLKQLTAETKRLHNELSRLPKGSAEFGQKLKEYQASAGRLKGVRSEIAGTNNVFSQMAGKLGPLAGLMGVTFGGAAVIGGIRKSVEAFREHERAVDRVTVAHRNNQGAVGRSVSQLTEAADAFEIDSLFKAEDILENVTTKLLNFGNISGEAFDRAQQAAVDWGTVTGDVGGAATGLGRALASPIDGVTRLARAGVIFSDQQKEVIKDLVDTGRTAEAQGIILDEFEKKFKGQAEASARHERGLRQLDQAFGDIVEGGGGFFNEMLNDIAGELAGVLRTMGDWFGLTNKQSDALQSQRIEMNALFNVLRTGNHTAEEQAQLVEEINREYGAWLPRTISVTDSQEELAAAQRMANAAMLEQITLLARQEILEEAQQEAVDARKEQLQAEIDLQRVRQGGATSWEKVLAGNMGVVNKATADLAIATAASIEANIEFEKLVGTLGSVGDAQRAAAANDPTSGGGMAADALGDPEEVSKRAEELRETLRKAREDMEMDRLEGADREIEQVKAKYLKIAQESAGTGVTIEEIENQQNAEIQAIRSKWGEKELERLRKLDDEIRKLRADQQMARVDAEQREELAAINARYATAREAVVGNNAAIAELDQQQQAEIHAITEQHRADRQEAANEAELQQVRDKYAKLYTEAKGNTERTKQLKELEGFELEQLQYEHDQSEFERRAAKQAAIDAFDQSVRDRQQEHIANQITLLEEQHESEMARLEQFDLDTTEQEERFREQRLELLEEQRQADFDALNASFEAQYALADEQGLSTTELQRMHGEATLLLKQQHAQQDIDLNRETDTKVIENRKKRADAERAIMTGVVGITRDLFIAAGADASEMATFEKMSTLFQIGLDTASAISSLTAMSEANPANAVTFGAAGAAQFITGIARITMNIAKASQLLSTAKPEPPAFAIGGGTGDYIANYWNPGTQSNVSITRGGNVGRKTLGWFGEEGPEWVSPNWMYQHPTLEPVFERLEHIRTSGTVPPAFAEGGDTTGASASSSTSQSVSDQGTMTLGMLTMAIGNLTQQLAAGTLARVSNDQLEDNNERINTIREGAALRQ